jgi:hypothetical protein
LRLLSVRLIVSLILGVALVSLFSTYYEVRREKKGLRDDLERRAEVLGESLVGNVEPYLDERSLKQLQRIVGRFSNREHLAGVAILNTKLEPIAQSSGLAQQLRCGHIEGKRFSVVQRRTPTVRQTSKKRLPRLAFTPGGYNWAGAATGKPAPLRACFGRSSSTAVMPSDAFCVSISTV